MQPAKNLNESPRKSGQPVHPFISPTEALEAAELFQMAQNRSALAFKGVDFFFEKPLRESHSLRKPRSPPPMSHSSISCLHPGDDPSLQPAPITTLETPQKSASGPHNRCHKMLPADPRLSGLSWGHQKGELGDWQPGRSGDRHQRK